MSKKKLSLLAASVCISLLLVGCKGEKGDPGSTGLNGGTYVMTAYTGTIPSNIDGLNTKFDISAPVLTSDSLVQVSYSSNTVQWWDYGFSYLDLTNKKIHVELGTDYIGWEYKAYVQNPS